MKKLNDYIVFDIETTGFSPKENRTTEIGAIKVIDGKIIATFNALLNWNIEIPAKITELTTIDKALLDSEGIDPEKAIEAFRIFIGDNYIPLIGHNILRFDIPFLKGNFYNTTFLDVRPLIDTAALYKMKKLGRVFAIDEQNHIDVMRAILNERHSVKYSIDTACVEFEIDKSKVTQHRAVGDCHLTKVIYEKLTQTV